MDLMRLDHQPEWARRGARARRMPHRRSTNTPWNPYSPWSMPSSDPNHPRVDPNDPNPPPNAEPEPEPVPDPVEEEQKRFQKQLAKYNPEFYGAGDMFKRESADLLGRSRGIDPLFAQVQEQLFGVIGNQENAELAGTSDLLSRQTGGMNTAGTLNELQRVRSGFGDRRTQLASQLKMQGLQRSDALRQESFDTRERSLGAYGTGLTNETIPLQLLIAEMNARNAGNVPKDKSGDCGSGVLGWLCVILTDELLRTGDLPLHLYMANLRHAMDCTTPRMYAGYRLWADPVRWAMRRSRIVHRAVKWAVTRYTGQIAGERTMAGAVLLWWLPRLSSILGAFCNSEHAKTCAVYR